MGHPVVKTMTLFLLETTFETNVAEWVSTKSSPTGNAGRNSVKQNICASSNKIEKSKPSSVNFRLPYVYHGYNLQIEIHEKKFKQNWVI